MLPDIGLLALITAFCIALGIVLHAVLTRDSHNATAIAARGTLLQWAAISLAFIALVASYVMSDFSVANVANNSHTAKPLLYKITGSWGNHEGSMLLWVWALSAFTAAFVRFTPPSDDNTRYTVIVVQQLIIAGFLAFILFTSNPFERIFPPPSEGAGLNPLLQDPGLAFHPPLLYLGYVGFSLTFSFAIAALWQSSMSTYWARQVRHWAQLSWMFLTLGIGLGSWWAYHELGWGGYWFWDPVENASLLPWLCGTALLHSLSVVEKRQSLHSWTLLLCIVTFSLCLLGTFLVRSGILTSVHAFANDPERGMFILIFLICTSGGALLLYALRAHKLPSSAAFGIASREGGILINNVLLTVACSTILLGTLYPLFLEMLFKESISVGKPYFDIVFAPNMALVAIGAALGPMLLWHKPDQNTARAIRISLPLMLAVFAAAATLYYQPDHAIGAGLGAFLSVFLLASTMQTLLQGRETLAKLRRTPLSLMAMVLAHCGLAVMIAGITAHSYWALETHVVVQQGERVPLGNHSLTFDRFERVNEANYIAERAQLTLNTDGSLLVPERRYYPAEKSETAEAAIIGYWWGDLYAAIGERTQDGLPVRFYRKPGIPWIWAGVLLMAAGGLCAFAHTSRRTRRTSSSKESPACA